MDNDDAFILALCAFSAVIFIGLVMTYGQEYPLSIAYKLAHILWSL